MENEDKREKKMKEVKKKMGEGGKKKSRETAETVEGGKIFTAGSFPRLWNSHISALT